MSGDLRAIDAGICGSAERVAGGQNGSGGITPVAKGRGRDLESARSELLPFRGPGPDLRW